jgi:hypothetical protein
MDWITCLDAWVTKSFVGEDTNLRAFYNISWVDVKGEPQSFTTQNFYDFIHLFRELCSICPDYRSDPRDNELMITTYH